MQLQPSLSEKPSGANSSTKGPLMTGQTGSYMYMAPEVFNNEPYNEKVCVRMGVGVGVASTKQACCYAPPPFHPLQHEGIVHVWVIFTPYSMRVLCEYG
jgi:hypothetical protein